MPRLNIMRVTKHFVTKERIKMTKEKNICSKKASNPSGAVYGFGFIGALVFFIQHASTFWIGVLGFLKALIWPALIVYKLLEFLKIS